MDEVLSSGAAWAVRKGYGLPDDLEYCEENGAMAGADQQPYPTKPSGVDGAK